MIEKEYWKFNQEWLDYIKRTWTGIGRVQQVKEDSPERLSFQERAKRAFELKGIAASYVKTYISIQVPKDGEGYDEQYPHTHEPKNATTLIHYLQPGDKPAPLDIFDGDEVIETIYPEKGLTVFMPNSILHGVRKNKGTTNRIQFIATGLI